MKKILLFACGLFLFGMASQAQSTDGAANNHRPRMERRGQGGQSGRMMMGLNKDLIKKLNLTEDQQTKLKTLNDDFRKKSMDIRNNKDMSDDQKRQAFRELFQQNREARNGIYTDQQKEIIKKDMQERRQNRGARRGGRRASGNQQH